ncbi:MAG: TonB-dependent receptor, partial [Bacteroidia bacterium]|nr:TonB-dependent receptor [Bacteroidia bacterium]
METQYEVRFSYDAEDLSEIFVIAPDETLPLEDVLTYLNEKLPLSFTLLDERYITVFFENNTMSVCGRILASDNEETLASATIRVLNSRRGVTTNELGQFQLEDLPVNALIEISYLGFRSKIIAVSSLYSASNDCPVIYLEVAFEELNQVVLTKFLTTGLQTRYDGSMVLNTKNFGILPGLTEPDVLQSIQALPGVESINESIANINVRGGSNDQNLMLWDGIKMYHSGHFFGLISAYNPHLTEKVIVTKNGTSSEFSDGVSSTIDMLTKDEIGEQVEGGVGLNLISADAFIKIPMGEKIGLHVSGRRSISDAYSSPTYEQYFKRSFQDSDINTTDAPLENSSSDSEFRFYDYTAKVLIDINENQKIRANLIGINNDLQYSESIVDSNEETETKSSSLKQDNLGVGLKWTANWSDRLNSLIQAYYSKYTVDSDDYRANTDQRLTQANEVLETGVKLKSTFLLNSAINISLGYQLNETGILNETTVSAPSYDRTKKDVLISHSLFTEFEFQRGNS